MLTSPNRQTREKATNEVMQDQPHDSYIEHKKIGIKENLSQHFEYS